MCGESTTHHVPSFEKGQPDMSQNTHPSRKRSASEEPKRDESEPEGSVPSSKNMTNERGVKGNIARAGNDSKRTRQENAEGFGKPFRNPMIIGSQNRNHTRQQNQALLIKQLENQLARLHDGQRILRDCMIEKVENATEKWVDAGREAAEYLWDLVGKNQSTEPNYNQAESPTRWRYDELKSSWGYDGSATSWGYDVGDNPKCDATGKDQEDRYLENSTFDPPAEDLPPANELIGESAATRHYNADGLAVPSIYPKPSTFKHTEDSEILTAYKPTKDVGWMMGQMGLDASLFGWNADEGNWKSS